MLTSENPLLHGVPQLMIMNKQVISTNYRKMAYKIFIQAARKLHKLLSY
jgi:hypothetical protein